jgi:DNA-binding PadR family transcriptional regulator
MSLRYALLGLLAYAPATGYELTQSFDVSLRNAWHASHSQIYPELRKLEEAGLVEVVSEGSRNSRSYGATDAGRKALRSWLVDTPPSRKVRDDTALRLFLHSQLEPDDRRVVLERELAYLEERQRMLQGLVDQLDALGTDGKFRSVITLGQRMMPVQHAWLEEQIEKTKA